jgi:hypothetical protein
MNNTYFYSINIDVVLETFNNKFSNLVNFFIFWKKKRELFTAPSSKKKLNNKIQMLLSHGFDCVTVL